MDLHDVWQENKRWILGCVLGLLVYWVGSSAIDSVYSMTAVNRSIAANRRAVSGNEYYDRDSLDAARKEHEELSSERDRLVGALRYDLADEFRLEGKGVPDLHFFQVMRRVKEELMRRANDLGIEVLAKDVDWAKAETRDEYASRLVTVSMIEQAAKRLFDAHEKVRAADLEAPGLVGIDQLHGQAARGSRRHGHGRPSDTPSAADAVHEEQVKFKFRADAATTQLFLEACRSQQPSLALGPDFKMTLGRQAGDPLTVSGTLVALRIDVP